MISAAEARVMSDQNIDKLKANYFEEFTVIETFIVDAASRGYLYVRVPWFNEWGQDTDVIGEILGRKGYHVKFTCYPSGNIEHLKIEW